LFEGVTRRKPSEKVVAGATYLGMIFLLGLMALVLYLDVFEHRFGFG
jgi:regulator of sigma E protease